MAEDDDKDQKTEQPTGKRLGEARSRGQLPISREVSSWFLFVSILVVVAWLAPVAAEKLVTILRVFIQYPHTLDLDSRGVQSVLFDAFVHVGLATVMIYLLLLACAVIGVMSQTGFFASLDLITPDFMRLNPANGFKRLFSVGSLVELGKSIVKLVVIGLLVYMILSPIMMEIPMFMGLPIMGLLGYMHDKVVHLTVILLTVYTLVAVVDLIYQRFNYIKNLRMTKTEVKDEHRQQDGDPIVKSRLRQLRVEKARKRMMAKVPKADVIVTNPTHYAIALQYDTRKMTAPIVLAKGIDQVAMRIRELGEENRIPMVSNPPLARTLYETVELDEEIPTQLYKAVAEVISYVYKLKRKRF